MPSSYRKLYRALVWALLAAVSVTMVYPLIFVTTAALRTEDDYNANPLGIPKQWTLENIGEAFSTARLGSYALNSLIVVVPATVLLTVAACLAAYAFVHLRFPFRRLLFAVAVGVMLVPPSVIMIPIFKTVFDLGLLNQYLGLILVYTSLTLPFSVYLMSSYFRSVPTALLEAAAMDGAGPWRRFWYLALPIVRPGVMAIATLTFLMLWNELLFGLLILQSEANRTIMVGVAQLQAQFAVSIPLMATGLLISIAPPLLVFLIFQRDLARGLTAGAVK